MAIWAYVGLPRNGKSYNVVAEQIIPALVAGRRVVTNIPLVEDELRKRGAVGEIVQVDQALLAKGGEECESELAKCTPGALCVFDEVWRFLPQGLQAKNVHPAWQSLFAEHGHRVDAQGRMMQIVLVTQDLSQIAAFARSLVERTVVITKLTVVGASSSYRADVYAGYVTGLKPPVSKRIAEEFGKYDPGVFKCYVSRTMAEGSAAKVDERVMSGRGTLLRHPVVRFGLPIAVCLVVWGLWGAYDYFYGAPAVVASGGSPRVDASRRPERSLASLSNRARLLEVAAMRYRIAAILRGGDDSASMVLVDHCDEGPGRWVPWHAARCADLTEGGVACEYRGRRYEFHGAIKECRRSEDERRSAEIQWFPADGDGSRESISVIGKSAVDGTGG